MSTETHRFTWEGIEIELTYVPKTEFETDPVVLRRQRKSRRKMMVLGVIVVVGLVQWGLS